MHGTWFLILYLTLLAVEGAGVGVDAQRILIAEWVLQLLLDVPALQIVRILSK